MSAVSAHSAGDTRRRMLATFVLIAALFLIPAALSSCRDHLVRTDRAALRSEGVPIIRVRLGRGRLESAEVFSSDRCRVLAGDRVVPNAPGALGVLRIRRSAGFWHFAGQTAGGPTLEVAPDARGRIRLGGTEYRGTLRLVAVENDRFLVVNHVDLETYLAGVLAKELYGHWSRETYCALAVAARTFALYQKRHFGQSHRYDLGDTQASQVYGGLTAATGKSWDAVRSTHGRALAYGPPGAEQIFLAQYSACCGGVVNEAGVLRNAPDIAPLRGGQRCDDCRACERYRWPPVQVSKRELYESLIATIPGAAELQGLTGLLVRQRTTYGRPRWVDAIGPNGKKLRLFFDDVRIALLRSGSLAGQKLYSMNCQLRDLGDRVEFFDGRGFGHGVGLCQWGAQGKAQRGWGAEEILGFYYPGARIIQAY